MPRRDQLEERARSATDNLPRKFTLRIQPLHPDNLRPRYVDYEFEPAPRQNDPVIRTIIRTIRQLQNDPVHGFLVSNNGVRVVPTTRAPPIWPPRSTLDAGESDIKFYTFLQDGKEFPATVPVSVSPRTGPLVPENLFVRTMGKWTPLKDWLLELADDDMIRRRSSGRAAQIWWKRNGIIAPLMKLPVELRLQIFEYVIAPQGEIYPISLIRYDDYNDNGSKENRAQAHVIMGICYNSRNFDLTMWGGRCYTALCYPVEARTPVCPPNTALLLVSKQIHQEAMQAGWEGVKCCFLDHQIFTAVSDSKIGTALNFNILGRIELSFANKGWFKFL